MLVLAIAKKPKPLPKKSAEKSGNPEPESSHAERSPVISRAIAFRVDMKNQRCDRFSNPSG